MLSHASHEGDHVLYDNCERCDQIAQDPFRWLDKENLSRLVHAAIIAQEIVDPSDSELVAVLQIRAVMRKAKMIQRILGIQTFRKEMTSVRVV